MPLKTFAIDSLCVVLLAAFLMAGLPSCQSQRDEADRSDWKQLLAKRLPEYGHRNWIVIADSAYPAQSRPGIETIVTGADQIDVVKTVLAAVKQAPHVKPTIYVDQELQSVPGSDAPGIEAYRQQLKQALGNQVVNPVPHDEIIAKLDQAGQTFKVLILKTNLTLPYTSVFLQLDCGYWNAEAEKRLRAALQP